MHQKENAASLQARSVSESQPGPDRDSHSLAHDDAGQGGAPTYLIGSLTGTQNFLDCCPFAATVCGWSVTLQATVVIQLRCKRWTCRHCGERLIAHYGRKCEAAKPNRFITLTCANNRWSDPLAAYHGTRKAVTALAAKLRRRLGEFEYFRVLEATKKGWPHYHLITRCPYVPQAELSTEWNKLTNAPIVDVRQVKRIRDVYSYVVKYLGKQKAVPWTNRRVAWSRHFWSVDDFKAGPTLEMPCPEYNGDHPASYLAWRYEGRLIETYSRDCWILRGFPTRTPGEEG